MKRKSKIIIKILLLSFFAFAIFSLTYAGDDNRGKGAPVLNKTTDRIGDAYRMFINNIDMPINRSGIIADVNINNRAYGRIDGITFLYSAGFFLSGKTNGLMWANAVASASRIQDYVPGTIASGRNDVRANLYVLRATDGDFSKSWQDWKDAVDLGAYFYDGDGDGVYNPVDKNANGKWDSDEDRPDLIGDETVWCVYNDATDPALRRYVDVEPQGIEIRQTVFGFKSKGVVGNMLFVRYSILNTGTVADVLDSVYLGVWADPDLGDAYDDLVGCDTTLNSGFTYNDGDDTDFGVNSPTFIIDFFQGPIAYFPGETFVDANNNGIYDVGETAIDTAYDVRGQIRGKVAFPGAKNLGLSSFVHYMQSHATLGDPNTRHEARNYMLGLDRIGGMLDPCTWAYANVLGGVPCATVNNKFWYSGDPVAQTGWINNTPTDQRQMSNTGPFRLEKGKPVDIVVAYVVGRGTNAINSITKAKDYDRTAQKIFNLNFPSPPPPQPVEYEVKTGKDFIDLTWTTAPQVNYRAVDTVLDIDRRVEGFYITAYKTNTKQATIGGVETAKEIAVYDMDNGINNIYSVQSNGGQELIRTEAAAGNKLATSIYGNPAQGRIRLRIDKDPFGGSPMVKGKEYYFSITTFTLNHKVIVERSSNTYGPAGDYLDLSGSGLEEFETPIIRVVFGEDLYAPALRGQTGQLSAGYSDGKIKYIVVDNESLTGDDYSVEFFKGTASSLYSTFWKLKNLTKGTVLIDSSKTYDYDTTNFSGKVTDGFVVRVQPVSPSFSTPIYEAVDSVWYKKFSSPRGTGVFYVGTDIEQGSAVTMQNNQTARSTVITADRLRKIELRFSTTGGKAYRYLNGFLGTVITRRGSFAYAGGVKAADTVGRGVVGKLGEGFVDIPFTAWVKDDRYKEERQLAVGFIELSTKYKGNPDGMWDPGDSLLSTGEVIIIFDVPYDPTGKQIVYTGGVFGTSTVWADVIKGFTIPSADTTTTATQKTIAKSPWFNAMYVVGMERKDQTSFFTSGDKLIIPMKTYPYTNADKFRFKTLSKGELLADEKKALFEKVNVYPNPLFAYNPATSYNTTNNPDETFITFSNLPSEITIKIYTLSGILIRTLTHADKELPTSPFLRWNLQNEEGLRVASGMYIAIVSSPEYGEKILKFAVIMPQKQIQRY